MLTRYLRSLLPALVLAALPMVSPAGVSVGVSVEIAPPPLPVYVQPPCPEPGYLWIPGYWAWGPYGYYWVPGTWVLPPEVGLLWTPGYWDWDDGLYLWHAGYWGPRVGFYGGIDYGYGYDGVGFVGGYWRRGVFFYNRAVMRVGAAFVTNVYYRPPMRHRDFDDHVSFNGGPHGVFARPSRAALLAERERRFGITEAQRRHERMARDERQLRARFNHGRPPIAATARSAVFRGRGVSAARAAGGPMRMRERAPMRSDRPPWVSQGSRNPYQARQGSQFERTGRSRRFARPAQRDAQRFNAQRPSARFERGPGPGGAPGANFREQPRAMPQAPRRIEYPHTTYQRPQQNFQRARPAFQRPQPHFERARPIFQRTQPQFRGGRALGRQPPPRQRRDERGPPQRGERR